jgi:uncharacterized membrane protein
MASVGSALLFFLGLSVALPWIAIAAIVALVAARRGRRLRELEGRVARLERALGGSPLPEAEAPPAPPPRTEAGEILPRALFEAPRPEAEKAQAAGFADLEERIGGRWTTWVGIVVLVFGVGLFLRWTIQNELIGPTARVGLGLVAGAVLLSSGLVLHEKRMLPDLAQGLAGGGLALLYLSLFAAHAVYELLPAATAFAGLAAVTLAGIVLAARTARQPIAVLALLGGLLTPVLVSAERPDERVLFVYLILLDGLVLGVARFRPWTALPRLGWLGSALLLVPVFSRQPPAGAVAERLALLSALFLLFAAVPVLRPWIERKPARTLDLLLVVANAAGSMTAAYLTLEPSHPTLEAPYAIALAGFYLAMARTCQNRLPEDTVTAQVHLGNAAVLLALAFPLAFDGPWVTAAWAVQGAVFLGLAPRLERCTAALACGVALLAASAARAITLDRIFYESETVVFNLRFLVGLLAVAACAFGGSRAAGIAPHRHALGIAGQDLRTGLWLLAVVLLGALLWVEPPGLWPSVLLGLEVVALARLAREKRERAFLGGTAVVAILLLWKTLLADHSLARAAADRLFNRPLLARIAASGALALAGSWLRKSPGSAAKIGRALEAFSAAALLVSLSLAWTLHQDTLARAAAAAGEADRLGIIAWRTISGLTVLWVLYGGTALLYGFLRRSREARYAGLVLLGVVVLKVFLVDLSEVQAIYRVVSFLALGVVLLGVSALYQKLRSRPASPASSREAS